MLESFLQERRNDQEKSAQEGSIQQRYSKVYSIGESMRNMDVEGRYDDVLTTREAIKESMKIINPLMINKLSDPRLINLNARLLALVEASNNTFDNPVYAHEQKEIAMKIMEEAMRFGALGKVDTSMRSGKELFVETMEDALNREDRIRKIRNHEIYPTFAFGLTSIRIDCDLDNSDKEVKVTLLYPMPNADDKFKQEQFDFFVSKNGLLFGDKGYDKITFPKEISFIKMSDVLQEVSGEIERLSNVPSTTVKHASEQEVDNPLSGPTHPVHSGDESEPQIVDPVREKMLVEFAKKHDRKEVGIVVVKSINKLQEGGTRFRDYRLYLFDIGIALLNPKVGNATYFIKYPKNEPITEDQLQALRECIDKHNTGSDREENETSIEGETILDFIFENMHVGFFQEGVSKSALRDEPNVTRITHNGDWQSRLETVFK